MNITIILLIIFIVALVILIIRKKSTNIIDNNGTGIKEPFMDDMSYQYYRNKLLGSKGNEIIGNHDKCLDFCKNIKQKQNCDLLCEQMAEDKSDDFKYQTHIFGSAIDKFYKKYGYVE